MTPEKRGQTLCILIIGLFLFAVLSMPVMNCGAWAEEAPMYPGYPVLFDGTGTIDRIADNEVVIDDSLHRLAPSVSYHTPGRLFVAGTRFHPGLHVGYLKDRSGSIVSLWEIGEEYR